MRSAGSMFVNMVIWGPSRGYSTRLCLEARRRNAIASGLFTQAITETMTLQQLRQRQGRQKAHAQQHWQHQAQQNQQHAMMEMNHALSGRCRSVEVWAVGSLNTSSTIHEQRDQTVRRLGTARNGREHGSRPAREVERCRHWGCELWDGLRWWWCVEGGVEGEVGRRVRDSSWCYWPRDAGHAVLYSTSCLC
jgi:hypothetical protein